MKRDYLLAIAMSSLLVTAPSALAGGRFDVNVPDEVGDDSGAPVVEAPSVVLLNQNKLRHEKIYLKNLPTAQQKQIEEANPAFGIDLGAKSKPLDLDYASSLSRVHFDYTYHPSLTPTQVAADSVAEDQHIIATGQNAALNPTPALAAAPAQAKAAVVPADVSPAAATSANTDIFSPAPQTAHKYSYDPQSRNYLHQGAIPLNNQVGVANPLNNQAGVAIPEEVPNAPAAGAAPQEAAVAQGAADPAPVAAAPAPQQPSLEDEVSAITDATSSLPGAMGAMNDIDKQSCKGLDTRGTNGLYLKGEERLLKIEGIVKRMELRSSTAKQAAPGDINALKLKDATRSADMAMNAKCMMVIPDEISGGVGGVEGEYGAGAYTCKEDGIHYGPYHFIQLRGANLGLQIGGKLTDRVLFFMNPDAETHLQSLDVKVGLRGGAVAGPFGRDGSISTRWNFKDNIQSYSESKGLYVGISLEGAVVTPDKNMNAVMDGDGVTGHKHHLFGWLGIHHGFGFGHRDTCEAVNDGVNAKNGQPPTGAPAAVAQGNGAQAAPAQ